MLRKILTEPDPILRKKCEPFEKVDEETKKLMDDMLETMYAAPGIGLAAIQVGILKRLVVIDISKESLSIIGSDAKELKTNQNNTTIMKPSLSLRSVLA